MDDGTVSPPRTRRTQREIPTSVALVSLVSFVVNRRRKFLYAAVIMAVATVVGAAGKSDVADAVMKGDKAALRTLLQQKADVNAPQVDGATALHWAVYKDDSEMMDLLLRAGAKVNVANRDGITPLYMASLYGYAPVIDKLLKAEAD